MRFFAYDSGRCRFECLGWFVLSGGRLARLGLLGDFGPWIGEGEGDGEGDMAAVISWVATPNPLDSNCCLGVCTTWGDFSNG